VPQACSNGTTGPIGIDDQAVGRHAQDRVGALAGETREALDLALGLLARRNVVDVEGIEALGLQVDRHDRDLHRDLRGIRAQRHQLAAPLGLAMQVARAVEESLKGRARDLGQKRSAKTVPDGLAAIEPQDTLRRRIELDDAAAWSSVTIASSDASMTAAFSASLSRISA
jgi:hypothetical protein